MASGSSCCSKKIGRSDSITSRSRTPLVDVPVDVLSGAPGENPSLVCLLSGQTIPLPPESLLTRYQDRADYESRFEAAADAAIAAGFVLEADRAALLAKADPDRIAG